MHRRCRNRPFKDWDPEEEEEDEDDEFEYDELMIEDKTKQQPNVTTQIQQNRSREPAQL